MYDGNENAHDRVLTLLPEAVVYLVVASGLGNEATNNTDFVPGPFAVRLLICVVGVALIGAFWSWRIRRKYGHRKDADVDRHELVTV